MKKNIIATIIISVILTSVMALSAYAAPAVLWAAEDLTNAWSVDANFEVGEGVVGNAVFHKQEANDMSPNIICCQWSDNPVNASAYAENGYLHVYVYISNIDEISIGQGTAEIEIYDVAGNYYAWHISDYEYENGWNELKLNLADAHTKNADLTNIAQTRLFQYGFNFTIGIDQLEIVIPGDEETEAPVTEAPVTEAPATEAPATEAPATEAPATDAPATDAPATDAPAPDTSDTVIGLSVAVCLIGAAACAVVFGKKRV